MDYSNLGIEFTPLPGHPQARLALVDSDTLLGACELAHAFGDRLVTLWASDDRDRNQGFCLRVALENADGLIVFSVRLSAEKPSFPDLSGLFPTAGRMQRAVADLVGVTVVPDDPAERRPWLRHANWPEDYFPLRRDADGRQVFPTATEDYAFVRVEGDGVHEIPVGPVHAGIIEPGHFRFSIVGEKVLRLEERLGYVHKGVEKRFESFAPLAGHRLAARLCGDSAVAFSWAYCQAIEGICATRPPPRALALRALALERERLANHLGDLGALGNDCGFAFGLTHFMILKEDLLRENEALFGSRYLMDFVVPGGVRADISVRQAFELAEQVKRIASAVRELRDIYDNHSGVQDRFLSAGRITPDQARQLGTVGLAGRASGVDRDLRRDHSWPPYDGLAVRVAGAQHGDVAARVNVRFDEVFETLRLIRELALALPEGPVFAPPRDPAVDALAIGWIEGWRGPVLVALEVDSSGSIRRCHAHDPSWHNWPTLEHAIMGNIVPDFPLINKSFNLSYSGHDL